MKKRLLLSCVISVLALLSCNEANVKKEGTGLVLQEDYSDLKIVTLDSCEYLYGAWGNATVLTHKGNCKHCKIKTN